MGNKFIQESFDKFKESTTRKHTGKLNYGKITVALRQFVKGKEIDSILLDYVCRGEDWVHLRNGDLKIKVDGEVISLKCHESNTKVQTEINKTMCYEGGFYKINKEQLKKICESSSVDLRFTGKSVHIETPAEWNLSFIIYCQQFYNGVIDGNAYAASLETTSLEKNVSSGCFVATATMGDCNHPIVNNFRYFRDNYLEKKIWTYIYLDILPIRCIPCVCYFKIKYFAKNITSFTAATY